MDISRRVFVGADAVLFATDACSHIRLAIMALEHGLNVATAFRPECYAMRKLRAHQGSGRRLKCIRVTPQDGAHKGLI